MSRIIAGLLFLSLAPLSAYATETVLYADPNSDCQILADGSEITFTGCNVNINNGGAKTATANGLGNLVLGYNEVSADTTALRTGSHNLVVGPQHEYTSWGGIVAGYDNTISAAYGSVLGGRANTVSSSASYGAILGGSTNSVSGTYATVAGGANNVASGSKATVSGGNTNTASGSSSAVRGGSINFASGGQSLVAGGTDNEASGSASAILGGVTNQAAAYGSAAVGGTDNTISAEGKFGVLLGGDNNEIANRLAVVCGSSGVITSASGELICGP